MFQYYSRLNVFGVFSDSFSRQAQEFQGERESEDVESGDSEVCMCMLLKNTACVESEFRL